MSNDNEAFEVATAAQLAAKYKLTAESRPSIKLNPARIPKDLHPLIPFAEFWGVEDDIIREKIMEKVSSADLVEFSNTVMHYHSKLYDWLTGPASKQEDLSDEYIALSAMGMAAELARVRSDNAIDKTTN